MYQILLLVFCSVFGLPGLCFCINHFQHISFFMNLHSRPGTHVNVWVHNILWQVQLDYNLHEEPPPFLSFEPAFSYCLLTLHSHIGRHLTTHPLCEVIYEYIKQHKRMQIFCRIPVVPFFSVGTAYTVYDCFLAISPCKHFPSYHLVA